MSYLSDRYDLPKPQSLPDIVFTSPADLLSRLGETTEASAGAIFAGDIAALYDNRTGTILLRHSWRGADPAEQSILVHELVHHLQVEAEHRYACPQAREKEAYRAQSDWLARTGREITDVFDIDPMMLFVLTNCGI